jgi:hypothetical protein
VATKSVTAVFPSLLDWDGTGAESFLPTSLAAFEVWDEVGNTDQAIHFGMFCWTDDLLAGRMVERLGVGVEEGQGVADETRETVRWINDQRRLMYDSVCRVEYAI